MVYLRHFLQLMVGQLWPPSPKTPSLPRGTFWINQVHYLPYRSFTTILKQKTQEKTIPGEVAHHATIEER